MGTDLIRPHIAVHALVTACCRGFVDVVDAFMKVKHYCDRLFVSHTENIVIKQKHYYKVQLTLYIVLDAERFPSSLP